MKPKPKAEPSNLDKIKQANYANCLKKLQAGKTLSAHEQKIIDEYSEAQEPKKKGFGRQLERMRWTVPKAASEFGVNTNTLTRYIKAAGILAGKDGKFSTLDVAEAIYGDQHKELLSNRQKENALLDIELSRARNEVIEVEVVSQLLESIGAAAKRIIMLSGLSLSEKIATLNELKGIKAENLVIVSESSDEAVAGQPRTTGSDQQKPVGGEVSAA